MVSLGIIAFAQMLVIVMGEIDLSVGAVYGLAPVAMGALWLGGGAIPFTAPFLVALAFGLALATLTGLLNGFLVVKAGLPSFIATLGLLNVAQGLQLLIGNAATFTPDYNDPLPPEWERIAFRYLGVQDIGLGVPIEIVWLVAALVLFWFLSHRTIFGFRLVAMGGNPEAAKIARLPISKYKYLVFLLSGWSAAVAGILDFSYVGSVGPSDAGSLLFSVIAAVVIGGASLSGGRGTLWELYLSRSSQPPQQWPCSAWRRLLRATAVHWRSDGSCGLGRHLLAKANPAGRSSGRRGRRQRGIGMIALSAAKLTKRYGATRALTGFKSSCPIRLRRRHRRTQRSRKVDVDADPLR